MVFWRWVRLILLIPFEMIRDCHLCWCSDCGWSLTVKKFETFFTMDAGNYFKRLIALFYNGLLAGLALYITFDIRKAWGIFSLLGWKFWVFWVFSIDDYFVVVLILCNAISLYTSFFNWFSLFLSYSWCFNLLFLYSK